MKLCTIEHSRCDEFDRSTLVWIPDDWAEEQFEEAVDRAKEVYLEAYYTWKKNKESHPEYQRHASHISEWQFLEQHPDMTVKEARQFYVKEEKRYNDWAKEYDKGKRTFSDFVKDAGMTPFSDMEPEFITEIYWGHRHGEQIEYDEKFPKDLEWQQKCVARGHAGRLSVTYNRL